MGKYLGEDKLPQREHPEGAVQYVEPENMKELAKKVNLIAVVITLITMVLFVVRLYFSDVEMYTVVIGFAVGWLLSVVFLVPHELLHGIAMTGDVKMYQNLKQGMLFVISTDDMSKKRFIFMSMLPNAVFGIIPFILFLIIPEFTLLGALGVAAIGSGAGDYLNVYNTIRQVPKNAKIYMSGMHTYWYE